VSLTINLLKLLMEGNDMIVAKLLSNSLKDAVTLVKQENLDHRRVFWLNGSHAVPYDPGSEANVNHEVELFGERSLCVGIAAVGTDTTYKALLVSDSFAPCVPVIAIGRTGTHLAHCNGSGGIMTYSSKWLKTHRIMVIQRERGVQQKAVSDAIALNLRKAGYEKVEIAVVPLEGSIGVIVAGCTALVYEMT
jgi:hypothetical protein